MLCSAFALALSGCGGKKGEQHDKPAEIPANGSASAPATAGVVEVFVDDQPVAKLTAEQLAAWPRVDALVPEASRRLGTWSVVQLVGGKPTELARPSSNYPDMVPVVFPGEGGTASFGMFDPVELAKKGKPGMREDGVRQIRIKLSTAGRTGEHQGGTGEGSDPSKISIAVKTPAGERTLTGEQLLALPRESMPGNEDTKGWRLTQLLEAAEIHAFERLVVLDAAGASVILERKDYDDKTTVPFIKLNRQGALRFRVMKQTGEGWQAAGDLRSIAAIQVVK
ncbi:MAG: hypothetical protein ACTHU0_10945 [Kofleriaceae bacterium]